MEKLIFNVESLSGHPYFSEGTELRLWVDLKPKQTKIVNEVETSYLPCSTELRKETATGYVLVQSNLEIPLDILDIINNGTDPETLLPKVNIVSFNQLLSNFAIKLR